MCVGDCKRKNGNGASQMDMWDDTAKCTDKNFKGDGDQLEEDCEMIANVHELSSRISPRWQPRRWIRHVPLHPESRTGLQAHECRLHIIRPQSRLRIPYIKPY